MTTVAGKVAAWGSAPGRQAERKPAGGRAKETGPWRTGHSAGSRSPRPSSRHEAEGLRIIIRDVLPANAPFRAWSHFGFRDGQGEWHEVDQLVHGRRLHLVELKYYSGTLRGDDLTWRRDGHRAKDSPLKLARRKAQRIASKLRES